MDNAISRVAFVTENQQKVVKFHTFGLTLTTEISKIFPSSLKFEISQYFLVDWEPPLYNVKLQKFFKKFFLDVRLSPNYC